VLPETWTYRQRYVESGIMVGPPHHGIGRACKVGKEEIVGLITALKLYVNRDHEADRQAWMRRAQYFAEQLGSLPRVRAEIVVPAAKPIPQVHLYLDEKALGLTAFDVVNRLLEGDPMIAVGQGAVYEGAIMVHPWNIEDGQEGIIATRLREVLMGAASG
jgi:D-glucosaminate-6-phosphate ammonia-lyase